MLVSSWHAFLYPRLLPPQVDLREIVESIHGH